jgi:hypothetical protein
MDMDEFVAIYPKFSHPCELVDDTFVKTGYMAEDDHALMTQTAASIIPKLADYSDEPPMGYALDVVVVCSDDVARRVMMAIGPDIEPGEYRGIIDGRSRRVAAVVIDGGEEGVDLLSRIDDLKRLPNNSFGHIVAMRTDLRKAVVIERIMWTEEWSQWKLKGEAGRRGFTSFGLDDLYGDADVLPEMGMVV